MQVAIAQINCEPGNVEHNLGKIADYTQQAKEQGADVIVFPELVDTGYQGAETKPYPSTTQDVFDKLSRLARSAQLTLITGVNEFEKDSLRYNSAAAFGSKGQLLGRYRKVHLFANEEADENERFTAGNELMMVTVNDFKIGILICYDLRFPEIARSLALKGADAIILPSAWPFPREEHFKILSVSRAIENQLYMICANRCGTDGSFTFCGNSRIVTPNGKLLASAGDTNEMLIMAKIDKASIKKAREYVPVFEHRREDVY